ncbi:LysR family transcriptional regulator [Colwellia sp. UCD-KL20]|uniref:LysR family transcriptional regulator n=1 Tax=Colwellia sp. UCD-KL20 TaxID=1917165 RepID=UPI0009710056|nr:LysR family transcriptional regulator [Colwellia sp. UCD-KL20]
MEFYHLRSFVVVAKTGNLTAAAKQLCTTPPAISAHIKSLEEELKTPLFERSSKGMALTEKGKLLLPKAEKTLNSAIDMVNLAVENQSEIIGEFKLSINQSPNLLNLPLLLENITENCQGIHLNIETLSTGAALAALQSNVIDGAYIYGDVPNELFALPIKQQKITTIAPTTTLLTHESLITDLAQAPWITMGKYCPFDDKLKSTLKQFTTANINTSSDETRLQLVKAGYGLSFLEYDEAQEAESLQCVKRLAQLDFEIPLFFAINKKRSDEPVIKAVLQEIKILWNIKQ